MTAAACRAPDRCPVPDVAAVDPQTARLAVLEPGRVLSRVYDTAHDPTTFNPSQDGDGRFSPLSGRAHAYLGDTYTVALLETVFHNVHPHRRRVVYEATDLAGRGLTRVSIERRLPLVDLRDTALQQLGIDRSQLVATTAAHYPCTRQWAEHFLTPHPDGAVPLGLLWNSRVAELAGTESPLLGDLLHSTTAEVCVLYDDHSGTMLSDAGGGFADLVGRTQGRLLVDQIAEQLDAVVV